MKKNKFLNEEESLNLYKEVIGLVKNIYGEIQTGKEFVEEDKDVINYVEKFVNQQYLGNDNILNLVNLSPQDDYIYCHVVNVCIISVDVGIGLGYNKSKLLELGITAILHDIGMIRLYDIYSKPRRLNPEEYEKIKSHPLLSVEILKKFKNISKETISAIHQEHERINGSGYPRGLKKNAIDEYAKIIGLVDVYEAMTHARPYRNKFHPYEALKEIIDAKDSFEKRVIKVLIERICCPYSLGSYLELNTGERGKVIKRNLKNPFRPTVEVSHDSDGKSLRKHRIVDLTKYPSVHIKGYLKDLKAKEHRRKS